ncbi:hypothetical protein DNTS_034635 [Danionella cerebrum]|uniref:Condensin-2 complex subunit H2 n=1 Tax=Danionella cerebrum TaxID=2873325 RepID=A0A553QLJ4_9TELE|nr:hypothetical protein DNTS_034635 [Danionella translucida]
MAMDSAEVRYAHLLQPLRDLTKNWDIDLASQLGEYLEELDQMTISFGDGNIVMNFAEAALLVQGTACIYGRKVELLHNLVFQTLDYISNKNKNDKKASLSDGAQENAPPGTKGDDLEFAEVELNENMNTLSITMKDPTELARVIRLPPASLIPASSHEKQKFPLLSQKGELLGSFKDFRINTFGMDETGMMCLGCSHSNFLKDAAVAQHNSSVHEPLLLCLECEGAEVNNNSFVPEDDATGASSPPLENHGIEMECHERVERQEASSGGRKLRSRAEVQPVSEVPKQIKETVDPWKLHDPYATFGEEKPLKIAKCYKVPAGLDESGKRKRKDSSKLQDFGNWFFKDFSTVERKLKNGPSFPDLNYIYVSKMPKQIKAQNQRLRKKGVFLSYEVLKKSYLEPAEIEEHRHADADDEDCVDQENHDLADEFEPLDEPEQIFKDLKLSRMSYENLVTMNLDVFLQNSKKYAQETPLSQRVKEWEDGIQQHVAAQEVSAVFDIRKYEDTIVQSFASIGERRTFASVVRGKENTEVCRYMLAALHLANDYSVEINKDDGIEESVDTMTLTLLSNQRAHERLTVAPAQMFPDPSQDCLS